MLFRSAIGDMQFCIEKIGIAEDLMVIAGDNLFTYRLRDAWLNFRNYYEDMVLATHMPPEENLSRYAIAVVDESGFVTDLEEKPDYPKTDIAVYATYFYKAETVPMIGQYLAEGNNPDAPGNFPAWLYKRKPLRSYLFDGICIDIGTPESYADVEKSFPVSATGEHQ